eukprot:6173315-Pleurochrysis_carterae.AAC.3
MQRSRRGCATRLGEELVLGLVHHVLDALALKQRDVREEHHAEDGVPKNLEPEATAAENSRAQSVQVYRGPRTAQLHRSALEAKGTEGDME